MLCLYLVQHFYTDLDLYQQCQAPQKIEEFKDFSRPLSDSPVLFKADLSFKDFSRKPPKFKYFSSLCEPCLIIHHLGSAPIMHMCNQNSGKSQNVSGLWKYHANLSNMVTFYSGQVENFYLLSLDKYKCKYNPDCISYFD